MNTNPEPRETRHAEPAWWRQPAGLALATAALIAVFYWLREHWGHVLGLAPYLLLLACPLMHLLHGHGRHEHRPGPKSTDSQQESSHGP
jgi:hypothetical protein